MGSSKRAPAKAGKTAAEAHQQRADGQLTASAPKAPASRSKKANPDKEWNFTHALPTAAERTKNGRQEGRNLITWTRPRMAEKFLLHIQYECTRFKIELPWDHIAHRFHPGSTGGALLQHLNRVRGALVAEGHLVPPICQKPGSRVVVDQTIRGYVRKFPDSDDTISSRPVLYSEPMDDRKFNLPDAFEQPNVPASVKRENMGGNGTVPRSTPKSKVPAVAIKKESSPEFSALNHDPGVQGKDDGIFSYDSAVGYGRSARACKKTTSYAISDEDDDFPDKSDVAGVVSGDEGNENYEEEDELYGDDAMQPIEEDEVDYDDVDGQSMAPSQGSVGEVGRLNKCTPQSAYAMPARQAHASYGARRDTGMGGEIDDFSPQDTPQAANHHAYLAHAAMYSQQGNPEDSVPEGFVVADYEEDDDDIFPADHPAVNGHVKMEPIGSPHYDHVADARPQPIPVVNHDDYDEDDIPPEGIPIYGGENDRDEDTFVPGYYGGKHLPTSQ